MTDPIADMLTRLRNAAMVRKQEVVLPLSRVKFEIAKILENEGYLAGVEKSDAHHGQLKLKMRYTELGPVIRDIQRISKPGRRVYATKSDVPHVLNGQGIAVISTSAGLMTNKDARKRGLGGEIVCEVY